MNDEQIELLVRVLNGLCACTDLIEPYNQWGANVGQCRYCGAIGEYKYGGLTWEHKEECIFVMNRKLQQSFQKQETP